MFIKCFFYFMWINIVVVCDDDIFFFVGNIEKVFFIYIVYVFGKQLVVFQYSGSFFWFVLIFFYDLWIFYNDFFMFIWSGMFICFF